MYIELYRPVEGEEEEKDVEAKEGEEEGDSQLRREDDQEHDDEHDEDKKNYDFCSNNFWREPRSEEEFGSVDDLLGSLEI